MSKSFLDKLPVILLYTESGSARVFFNHLLTDEYYLVEVESEKELLEKIQSMKIYAVIIDDSIKIQLPYLCKKIKEDPSAKSTPVLIISNNLKRSYLQELLSSGATDFLRTPLDEETVKLTLKNSVKHKSIEKKLGPLAQSLSQNLTLSSEKILCKTRIHLPNQAFKQIIDLLNGKHELSLLMIDIDVMDKVHQRWGDEGAQELLFEIEKFLKSQIREQDFLCEISKKRLVIILPSTTQSAANIFAENIQNSIKEHKFTTSKGSVKLKITIAVVSLTKEQILEKDAYLHLENLLTTGEAYLEKAKILGGRIVSN